MAVIYLKAGREKSVWQLHPWVFSGAIERVEGNPGVGETVQIISSKDELLALAAYSPTSKIRARIWTWNVDETIDESFFENRLRRAIALRRQLIPSDLTDAMRLVHGESDGLPGIVVDQYANVLVLQLLSAGADRWRDVIVQALVELTGIDSVYERSDVEVRKLEGLEERVGLLHGKAVPERIAIKESGFNFWVDVKNGQKTGFYLDQRQNRIRLADYAKNRNVLNCFCYTGAFSVYALASGASDVLSIDSSGEAIEQAKAHVAENHLAMEQTSWIEGDVFKELRLLRDRGKKFDLIILDPPKFAPTAAQAEQAARGYKDINLLAFKLLAHDGILFTFSCSGGISAELFQKIVAGAAADAGVEAQILEHLAQAPDHPVALNFPEGAYLKGLVCRVP
jgi:23S rRNA (cytosine1962-C5)-methyltransferase